MRRAHRVRKFVLYTLTEWSRLRQRYPQRGTLRSDGDTRPCGELSKTCQIIVRDPLCRNRRLVIVLIACLHATHSCERGVVGLKIGCHVKLDRWRSACGTAVGTPRNQRRIASGVEICLRKSTDSGEDQTESSILLPWPDCLQYLRVAYIACWTWLCIMCTVHVVACQEEVR